MRLSFLLLAAFLPVFLLAQTPSYGGKLKPEQANMDIQHYTIALTVDIPSKSIAGFTEINLLLKQPATDILFDLMDSLKVEKVWVNGKPAEFSHAANLLHVTAQKPFAQGSTTVKVQYGGHPVIAKRPPWEDGFTFTHDSAGHPWIAVTAEGTGGKIYFPCKDHPSDEPDHGVDMKITVPQGLVVAGPGLLQSVITKKHLSTYYWKTNYTINNYSILFNVGDYTVVKRTYTSLYGDKIPMEFYVLKIDSAKAQHHLDLYEIEARVKEKYFGEYPWAKEKIGLVETPHLGMEHQTMVAYGNQFRYTKIGGEDFDWLMNHEFGHEWWGNKVTARDWADYWIHEGIGSFGDALYTYDKEGEDAYERIFQRSIVNIKNDKPVVLGKDIEEEEAYHPDIYSKGAFFMHTLRYVMGDSLFFPALKKLATDSMYTYSNLASTEEVQQLFTNAYGKDLAPLFHLYLYTINKLEVHIHEAPYNTYTIKLDNIDMPLPLDITTSNGTERVMVDKKGVVIKSNTLPLVDTRVFYIKRVIYE
ncbi:MAG TPA: M1 family metallopeptidase [Chitinophagaceae bacterium]|nr:M1 family metallopeptidase [Chitinophagaceae bacterium]